MKNSTIALIFAAIGISSCSDQHIYVFVSNESSADSVVQLEVYLNKEKKLHQAFRYTNVIPDYDEFKFSVPRTSDSIVLDITSNTGVVKSNIRVPRNQKYIFVAYSYKAFGDSVIKPRDVIIASYKRMPQLE